MNDMITMDQLRPKQSAYIRSIGGSGALRHHLLDMGLTPKTEVTLRKIARPWEIRSKLNCAAMN